MSHVRLVPPHRLNKTTESILSEYNHAAAGFDSLEDTTGELRATLQATLDVATQLQAELSYLRSHLGVLTSEEVAELLLYQLPTRLSALELAFAWTDSAPYLQRSRNANVTTTEVYRQLVAGANMTLATLAVSQTMPAANALAVDRSGATFLLAGRQGNASLWRAPEFQRLWQTAVGSAAVVAADMSLDGERCLLAYDNGSIAVLALETGSVNVTVETGDADSLSAAMFAHAAPLLVSAGRSIDIWNATDGGHVTSLTRSKNATFAAIALSARDEVIAAMTSSGRQVRLWNVTTGAQQAAIAVADGGVAVSLALADDASRVYAGMADAGSVHVYSTQRGAQQSPLLRLETGCNGTVSHLALAPTQPQLIAATSCGTAVTFDVSTPAAKPWRREMKASAAIAAAALSASDVLVVADAANQTTVFRRLEDDW